MREVRMRLPPVDTACLPLVDSDRTVAFEQVTKGDVSGTRSRGRVSQREVGHGSVGTFGHGRCCRGGAQRERRDGVVLPRAKTTRDDVALRQHRAPERTSGIEQRIDALMRKMTLDEKLNQLTLLSDGQINDAEARKPASAASSASPIRRRSTTTSRSPSQQSRLHIPILFAFDTIHGFRTHRSRSRWPPPAASIRAVAATDHAIGAARVRGGRHQADLQPDGRRLARAALGPHLRGRGRGPVPELGHGRRAREGRAGQRLQRRRTRSSRSVKHFAAYGQPETGRDYNTTDMSAVAAVELLPAAVQGGDRRRRRQRRCARSTRSTACPAARTPTPRRDVLKQQWGFDGFIESDYTAVAELRACPPVNPNTGPCGHGIAEDGPEAAQKALNARHRLRDGLDQLPRLRQAARRRGTSVSMQRIDDAVRRILRVKFRAGLFDHVRYNHVDNRADADPARPTARPPASAADRSMVLLKNDGPTLPFDATKKTAVIGPLGQSLMDAANVKAPGHDMLGPWWGMGRDQDAVDAVRRHQGAVSPGATYTPAARSSHNDLYDPAGECASVDVAASRRRLQSADQVVLALGETREMSGEAEARSNIRLPGQQQQIIDAVKATGKPFVGRAVQRPAAGPDRRRRVLAGDPRGLVRRHRGGRRRRRRRLRQGQPGRQAAGRASRAASARCRSTTTTSRPAARATSTIEVQLAPPRHRQLRSPLYEFGYGLSYTTFKVSNLRAEPSRRWTPGAGNVTATVDVTNTGDASRATRSRSSTSTTRSASIVAAGAPPARLPARDAGAGSDAAGELDADARRTSASTTTAAKFRRRERDDRGLRRRHLERVRQQGHVPRGQRGRPLALGVPERVPAVAVRFVEAVQRGWAPVGFPGKPIGWSATSCCACSS